MEKSSKLPPLPAVLTGNSLRGGEVVYFDGSEWSTDIARGLLATNEAEARRLEATAATSLDTVIDAYLVSAATDADGRAAPLHYREAIRAAGPTIKFGSEA